VDHGEGAHLCYLQYRWATQPNQPVLTPLREVLADLEEKQRVAIEQVAKQAQADVIAGPQLSVQQAEFLAGPPAVQHTRIVTRSPPDVAGWFSRFRERHPPVGRYIRHGPPPWRSPVCELIGWELPKRRVSSYLPEAQRPKPSIDYAWLLRDGRVVVLRDRIVSVEDERLRFFWTHKRVGKYVDILSDVPDLWARDPSGWSASVLLQFLRQ
jgi:hypothetical protein